jgi:hypothetical protein
VEENQFSGVVEFADTMDDFKASIESHLTDKSQRSSAFKFTNQSMTSMIYYLL